jgi:SAM-dependent methyltransferase
MLIYNTGNPSVFQQVPENAKKVLDIGCGSGVFGQAIKNRINCEVVGITYSQEEFDSAVNLLDKVILMDLNEPDFSRLEVRSFDCIICSHVLEHLYWPRQLLKKLAGSISPSCKLVVALPNVLNFRQRLEFLKGNFKYSDWGVMDRTHFRFFDWDTSLKLLEESGYTVVERWADGYFPLPVIRNFIKPLASHIDSLATRVMPSLFGMQFVLIAYLSSQK